MAYRKDLTVSIGFLTARCDVETTKDNSVNDTGLTQLCANGHDPAKPCWDPVCAVCDAAVKREDLVKGREVGDNSFVLVTDEELNALKELEASFKGKIALTPHDAVEVESKTMPSGTTYYLTRNAKDEHYGLVRHAVETNPQFAFIGIYTVASRSALYRAKVYDGCLVLEQLLRPEELKPVPVVDAPVNEALVGTLDQVLEAFVTEFDPATYRSTYAEQVNAIVEARESTGAAALPAAPSAPANADDALLAQMEAFLADKGGNNGTPRNQNADDGAEADPSAKPKRTRKPKAPAENAA